MTTAAGQVVNNSSFIISEGLFSFTITSTVPLAGGSSVKLGFVSVATGGANSQGNLSATIFNGTGGSTAANGDSDASNNNAIKVLTIQ